MAISKDAIEKYSLTDVQYHTPPKFSDKKGHIPLYEDLIYGISVPGVFRAKKSAILSVVRQVANTERLHAYNVHKPPSYSLIPSAFGDSSPYIKGYADQFYGKRPQSQDTTTRLIEMLHVELSENPGELVIRRRLQHDKKTGLYQVVSLIESHKSPRTFIQHYGLPFSMLNAQHRARFFVQEDQEWDNHSKGLIAGYHEYQRQSFLKSKELFRIDGKGKTYYGYKAQKV